MDDRDSERLQIWLRLAVIILQTLLTAWPDIFSSDTNQSKDIQET
jgi:hypothetical protein